MLYRPAEGIGYTEFYGESNGLNKICLRTRISRQFTAIHVSHCQIKIFEKIMKNVFYVEFRDESNGTNQIDSRDQNPLQN